MSESRDQDQDKENFTEITTFPIPFALGENQGSLTANNYSPSKPSKEQIIKRAINFHIKGDISQATKHYQQLISKGCNDYRVFSNYGIILKDLGKLHDAALSFRKAIKLNPNLAEAHSNLGNILKALGEIDESILNFDRSLTIKPNMPEALVGLAKSLLIKGQYIKALNLLKKGDGTISFDLKNGVSIYQK